MSEKTNTKELDRLIKVFKGKLPYARTGILGKNNTRNKGAGTNAEIGMKHEFGDGNLPMRSFLRMPIIENLSSALVKNKAFDKESLNQVVKQKSLTPWMEDIAKTCEAVVADAFATGGNGKWPAWKTPNYENNTGQLLVDTQQLRNSITSEVLGGS